MSKRIHYLCWALLLGLAGQPLHAQEASRLASGQPWIASVEHRDILDRPARLYLEEAPVITALEELVRTSGVPIAYSPALIPATRVARCDCAEATVRSAIRTILSGTSLEFVVLADQVVIRPRGAAPNPRATLLAMAPRGAATPFLLRPASQVAADIPSQATGTITGSVRGPNGQPISGATVNVEGTTRTTQSDAQGRYTLTGVPTGSRTVRATYAGYTEARRTVTVAAQQSVTADLVLQQQVVMLEGVVAVGYGDQERQNVTGSIGVVSQEVIESIPLASPDQALIGQVAGVNVTMPTGLPGGAPQIQVRGVGAVGAGNQPLFVVDGFALPQPDNQSEARFQNPLSNIPADDIESITILKDASATAIYGSRASNGVVIITTKSGVAGPRRVELSSYWGVQNEIESMRPRMANARQFVTWQNIRYQDMLDRGVIKEIPEPYRNPEAYGEGTDWFGLISRPAYLYNVQASVSGGSQAVRSFFSGGLQRQEGVVPGTDFTRLSLRANVESELAPGLQGGLRLAPSFTLRNQPTVQEGRGNATGTPMLVCPLATPRDEEGSLVPFIESSALCPGIWTLVNPLYALENVTDQRTRTGALVSSNLQYELGRGLTANTSLNAEWVQGERKYFSPSTIGGTNRPPPAVPSGGYSAGTDLNWLSETTVNLNTEIGPGDLDALAGITFQRQENYDATFNGIFPDDDIQTLNVASNLIGASNEQSWSLLSYLARVNYSWADRLVFTGTVRADGSSRFGSRNRWGTFPSGAVAWNLHNEGFMSGVAGVIPELRLRLSYGVTGNNQIGNYSHLGIVQRDDYLYGSSVASGRRVVSLGNEELGWERTNEWNLGLEAAFFDHRLRASVDAYTRMTTDLLIDRALPTSSGFPEITDNAGTVRNRGVEISLNSQNVSTDDFSWSTDFSLAANQNRVISLPGGEPIFSGSWGGQPTHMTAVGQPLGIFIGLVHDGIYQNAEEIAAGPRDDGVIPGNIRWRDVNGDGVITLGPPPTGDYDVIGNPHPDFTFNITNSVTLGRFDVRTNVSGRKGGDVLRFGYYQSAMNVEGVFNVAEEYVENMWLPGRPGTMPTPLGSREAIRRFHTQHSEVVASGSNIWVRNASLRYELPANLAGSNAASLYLTVQNPFVFTRFRGNPEVQNNQEAGTLTLGVENFAYPVARQFTLGVDLGF